MKQKWLLGLTSLVPIAGIYAVFFSGPRWPADNVSVPNFEDAVSLTIPKHKMIAYSVPAEAKLPKWVITRRENEYVGPEGAEMFVIMSRPWPTEEDAMRPTMGKLLQGQPFQRGDAMVVARPWIGSREPKDPIGGKRIERYLLMTDELFLDLVIRVPEDSETAQQEGRTMVQYLLHSVKRIYPSQTVYRDTSPAQSPDANASRASDSSR